MEQHEVLTDAPEADYFLASLFAQVADGVYRGCESDERGEEDDERAESIRLKKRRVYSSLCEDGPRDENGKREFCRRDSERDVFDGTFPTARHKARDGGGSEGKEEEGVDDHIILRSAGSSSRLRCQ